MVVSEGQKAQPNAAVLKWIESVDLEQTYLSATTIGEIRYGIARLPQSARRSALDGWLTTMLVAGFHERIIDFDTRAALAWGDILASAVRRGATMQKVDAQIAAIAKVHSLTLVTRNARHFAGCGIEVLDPWS